MELLNSQRRSGPVGARPGRPRNQAGRGVQMRVTDEPCHLRIRQVDIPGAAGCGSWSGVPRTGAETRSTSRPRPDRPTSVETPYERRGSRRPMSRGHPRRCWHRNLPPCGQGMIRAPRPQEHGLRQTQPASSSAPWWTQTDLHVSRLLLRPVAVAKSFDPHRNPGVRLVHDPRAVGRAIWAVVRAWGASVW